MIRVMVRYKVKPERREENEALIRAVYQELERTAPSAFSYATFRLDDGVSFMHIASDERERGHGALREVKAFQEFQREIGERCVEAPVVTELEEIGSFGFWR